jgi:hypothetical protein
LKIKLCVSLQKGIKNLFPMSILSSFFRPPKYKRFHYEPLYYNKEKEEREKRNRWIIQEVKNVSNENYVSNIKGAFRQHHEATAKIKHRANSRFVIILGILLLIAYFLIF